MAYIPPPEAASYYTNADLDHVGYLCRHIGWAVHLIGPDEMIVREHPEAADSPEFTQRTALRFAADHNAFATLMAACGEQVNSRAVVLHNGEPWTPDPKHDGPADQYCEWFDWSAAEWFCNQCLEPIAGQSCPTCAPTHVPGLYRLPCDVPDEHPAVFMYATNTSDGFGPPCFYCIEAARNQGGRWAS